MSLGKGERVAMNFLKGIQKRISFAFCASAVASVFRPRLSQGARCRCVNQPVGIVEAGTKLPNRRYAVGE